MAPRRPIRLLEKENISQAYPNELVADFESGDLVLVDKNGSQKEIPGSLTTESSGSGNAITDISADGHKITVTKGATFLTKHPNVDTISDTTSTATPAEGETFEVVDSVTRDGNGHVTKVNTKTVTLPTHEDKEISIGTPTGTGNAITSLEKEGNTITPVKGDTFLTEHPAVAKGTDGGEAKAPGYGGAFSVVSGVTKDANGHVTAVNTDTVTMPSAPVVSSTSEGTGNAVTDITFDGMSAKVTKSATFLTEHPTVAKETDTSDDKSVGFGGSFDIIDSVSRDSNGHVTKVNTKTITMPDRPTNIQGNAMTADALKTPIDVSIQGAVTGSATGFDGSEDLVINTTSIDATKISGVIPIENIPQGALERMIPVTNDAARLALTIDKAQNGDVIKVEDTGLMYYVVDETKLGTEEAFSAFTAGSASTVPWSGVTNKPNFATVATTGNYEDLINKPAIPSIPDLSKGSTVGSGNAVTDVSVSGHEITLTKGATFLTEHPDITTETNTTSTETATHGGTVKVVDSVSKDDNGHVTKVNTKTVTLPSETPLSIGTTTGTGNAVTDVSVDGHKVNLTKGATFLTEHPAVDVDSNTTSAETATYGGTFEVIDSISKDATGHVTKFNTKTVTMPSAPEVPKETDVHVTESGEGNAVTSVTATGHEVTVTKGATFLTEHPALAKRDDSASTVNATYGGKFTVIDGIARDDNGHITKINTKTMVMPDAPSIPEIPDVSVNVTGTGNAVTDVTASGHTVTATKGATFLTEHPAVTKGTDGGQTKSPGYGGTFSAVSGITRDANGHVTAVNTDTVTMPSEQDIASVVNAATSPLSQSIETTNSNLSDLEDRVDTVEGTANTANTTANSANTAASNALSAANTANTNASTALTTANSKASTTVYSATIGTTWTGSAAPYTQTVTVSGMLASDTPIVDCDLSSIAYANKDSVVEAYSKVYRITTAANSITIYADEKTTVAVPIQLKVVR